MLSDVKVRLRPEPPDLVHHQYRSMSPIVGGTVRLFEVLAFWGSRNDPQRAGRPPVGPLVPPRRRMYL